MKKPTHKLFKDLTGQVFGMYTVLEYAGEAWPEKKRNRGHQWKCKCGCGEERVVIGSCLKSGKSTGCGCTRNKHRLIDLKGKKWTNPEGIDKYFNNLDAWRIESPDGNSGNSDNSGTDGLPF